MTDVIDNVLKNAYISIDEKDNIVIKPDRTIFDSSLIAEFNELWDELDNMQQLEALGRRFGKRRSVQIK